MFTESVLMGVPVSFQSYFFVF